jgi:hypothetical protein
MRKKNNNIFVSFLEVLHVKHTKRYSNKFYGEHPYKYNLYGLSTMFSDYNIENKAVRIIDKEQTVIEEGRWKAHRVILEYSAATPFYLTWLPRKKMIVFQRLEAMPVDGSPGRVPSGEFDGLRFHDGAWKLQKNVDVTPEDFK